MNTSSADWQALAVVGLKQMSVELVPAMELLYLDLLASHLLGPDAPKSPYTIEHGAKIVSLLLQAAKDAPVVLPDLQPQVVDVSREVPLEVAREAVVNGAHQLASSGGRGAQRLATRFLAAAVGELENHKDDAEAQVRSLFYYGLLAVASGPDNLATAEISDGVMAAFHAWDTQIGEGFVPPWRIATPSSSH